MRAHICAHIYARTYMRAHINTHHICVIDTGYRMYIATYPIPSQHVATLRNTARRTFMPTQLQPIVPTRCANTAVSTTVSANCRCQSQPTMFCQLFLHHKLHKLRNTSQQVASTSQHLATLRNKLARLHNARNTSHASQHLATLTTLATQAHKLTSSQATLRNTSQHVSTRRNTSQHATTRRNTSQHVATRRNTPQHVATRRNTSQHVATRRNTSQHIATRRNTSQHVATRCNTSQQVPTGLNRVHLVFWTSRAVSLAGGLENGTPPPSDLFHPPTSCQIGGPPPTRCFHDKAPPPSLLKHRPFDGSHPRDIRTRVPRKPRRLAVRTTLRFKISMRLLLAMFVRACL